MRFFLVRHGETEWNRLGKFQGHLDIALNQRGLSQARETAQALAPLQPTGLYSSPLGRAMQAAQEISRVVGLPIIPEEGIKELSLGDLEGATSEEMRTRWPQVYGAWRHDPSTLVMPNGESLAQLQERAWQAVLKVERLQREEATLVVVSHNFAIRAIIGKVLGMPLSSFHCMELSLASICAFKSDQRGRRLTSFNSTGHLSPENR